MSMADMLDRNNITYSKPEHRATVDSDTIASQKELLKAYRAVSAYTESAVKKAIVEINKSVNDGTLSDDLNSILKRRQEELTKYLRTIQADKD